MTLSLAFQVQGYRKAQRILKSKPTTEGAGVHLFRAFGPNETGLLDPFLMLDDFHSSDPEDYMAGFPRHPHRGIETVTYMIRGVIDHQDSMGNKGTIRSGDVQWMTAGSGILHQEMPQSYDGEFQGFQLWINLPASKKMMDPRYRGIDGAHIPTAKLAEGVEAKVIAGQAGGVTGPVKDLIVKAEYLDVMMGSNRVVSIPSDPESIQFAYVFEGLASDGAEEEEPWGRGTAVVFGKGDSVRIRSERSGARFLLISGRPLREPIAWGGPIVMNTDDQLDRAFEELRLGTFIKSGAKA